MLESGGIIAPPQCSCRTFMLQMVEWGVEGCRDQFDAIVKRLRDKANDWGWTKVFADKSKESRRNHVLSLKEKIGVAYKSITRDWLFRSTGLIHTQDWPRKRFDAPKRRKVALASARLTLQLTNVSAKGGDGVKILSFITRALVFSCFFLSSLGWFASYMETKGRSLPLVFANFVASICVAGFSIDGVHSMKILCLMPTLAAVASC